MHLLPLLPAGPLRRPGTLRPLSASTAWRGFPGSARRAKRAGGSGWRRRAGGARGAAAASPLPPRALQPVFAAGGRGLAPPKRDWDERGETGKGRLAEVLAGFALLRQWHISPGARGTVASTAAASRRCRVPAARRGSAPDSRNAEPRREGKPSLPGCRQLRYHIPGPDSGRPPLRLGVASPAPSLPPRWVAGAGASANQRRDRAGAEGPAQRPGIAGSCQGHRGGHAQLPVIPILLSMHSQTPKLPA